jgi:hypothetical protein
MTLAATLGCFTYENEPVRGIEPPCAAWEAAVLPLNYTRIAILDFRFSIADCNSNNSRSKIADCSVRCPQRISVRNCEPVLR